MVIELKRTDDGGHMELQAIRYAAMVSTMTFERAVEVYAQYLARTGSDLDARAAILEFLEWDEPDEDSFAQYVTCIGRGQFLEGTDDGGNVAQRARS